MVERAYLHIGRQRMNLRSAMSPQAASSYPLGTSFFCWSGFYGGDAISAKGPPDLKDKHATEIELCSSNRDAVILTGDKFPDKPDFFPVPAPKFPVRWHRESLYTVPRNVWAFGALGGTETGSNSGNSLFFPAEQGSGYGGTLILLIGSGSGSGAGRINRLLKMSSLKSPNLSRMRTPFTNQPITSTYRRSNFGLHNMESTISRRDRGVHRSPMRSAAEPATVTPKPAACPSRASSIRLMKMLPTIANSWMSSAIRARWQTSQWRGDAPVPAPLATSGPSRRSVPHAE